MAKSTDIKEKIRHLLALAQSPNEHEALAALLKARELMARHKLTEATLEKANGQAVKDIKTNITFSKRRDPWIASLSSVICKSYCCKGYRTHIKGRQTQTVGFIGLENDVEICTTVFRYAVDCVYAEIKRIKIENEGRPRSYVGTLCDSYGYGFAAGVFEAFNRQQQENKEEWGLVLTMPQEVREASQNLRNEPFKAEAEDKISPQGFVQGYADGKRFDPKGRLTGEAAT